MIPEDHTIHTCLDCGYIEGWKENSKTVLFTCKNLNCLATHCTICEKSVIKIRTFHDVLESCLEPSDDEKVHLTKCVELREEKEQFDEAFKLTRGRNCPECGLFGRKDDACTHMTCERC